MFNILLLEIVKLPVNVPPPKGRAPIFAGVMPKLVLASAAVVAPVPPFEIGIVSPPQEPE